MKRSHLIFLALGLLASLGFLAFALLRDQSKGDNVPDRQSVARLLHPWQPSIAQARAHGIPLSPRADQPQQHYHVALRILWGGGLWPVPRMLGITSQGQELAMHTHDATGILHCHRPTGTAPFRLGQVMWLWGLPIKSGRIQGQEVQVWRNRKPWTGWQQGELSEHDDIVVVVGADLQPPPAFAWQDVPLARD